MKRIDAQQLKQAMGRPHAPPVINVLPRDEFDRRHIPGSINIPMDDDDFVARVEDQVSAKGDPLVVYCASADCDASERAARRLEEAGFTQVQDFETGVQGWEEAGYILEGGEVRARR